MSRIRLLFRPPPFKPYHPRAAQRHTSFTNLDLPLQSRIRWSYFWYASILALGITTGLGARQLFGSLGLAEPGSPADKLILESLSQDIDTLDIVQSLRKQSFNLHSDAPITGAGSTDRAKVQGWVEVNVDSAKAEDAHGGKSGLLGTMSGTRGLGVQRAFWNAETKEMVAVVWIGGGLAGWPGVAHGGAIATVFEETMSRMVKGPNGTIEPIHRPTSLSITYAKPTNSLDFYILRTSFQKPDKPQGLWGTPPPELEVGSTKTTLRSLSSDKDFTKRMSTKKPVEVVGTLESVNGIVLVKVKATFDAQDRRI